MSTIPKLGRYVNDEIAYELHKLNLDKVIKEYYEKYRVVYGVFWYVIDGERNKPCNYRNMRLSYISTHYIRRPHMYIRRIDIINLDKDINLPQKYYYTSGLNYGRGYKQW